MGKKAKKIRDMEPDDEIEAPETVVHGIDIEGFDHEFERSLENAFAENGIVVLTVDRKTGEVNVDFSLSSPLEAWAACATGESMLHNYLDGGELKVTSHYDEDDD